ncbi:MAG: archease [Anaerolineae bacterium]
MASGYREVAHTADVALEIWAPDLPGLLAQAGHGLFDLAAEIMPGAEVEGQREVHLSAPDDESLLVDWLNELLTLYDEHGEAYVAFDITEVGPHALVARLGATHAFRPRKAVKAATFHDLTIRREPEGLRTVVVFDV